MQTGLVTMEDGTVLFFGADGKQAMGLQTVDGKTYYFNDLGMAVNTKQTIDGKPIILVQMAVCKPDWLR